ncbi:CPBP family intramembrane glutamic endopeptidase [Granulicella paludicola]|uniref:CPBP family intramembrane glutamic endopeptidase n=1 Tax=Granulicella paludicola TaxID=474951 RepID=UPI0021E097DF|nr:CPBP family intramembrane glutamic endopeptidase [Granulicella paludicola]
MSDPTLASGGAPTPVSGHETASSGGWRRIFVGADGLRAGWSLILFYVCIAALRFVVKALFKALHQLDPDQLIHVRKYPIEVIVSDGIPFLVVMLALWLMSRVERRSISSYGIGATPGSLRQFVEGLVWGAGLLSLLVLILWRLHLLVFDGLQMAGLDVLRYSVEWALGFLCVGLLEEAVSRGYLQFTLSRGIAGPLLHTRAAPHARAIGFWGTAVLTSILFGLGHLGNNGESPVGLFLAGLMGFAYTLSLWRTGSLWWAIGMHAAWDWAQSFVFGVADSGHVVAFNLLHSHPQGSLLLSGGPTGPEGSVYALPIAALAFAAILWTQRPGGWPPAGSHLSERSDRDR